MNQTPSPHLQLILLHARFYRPQCLQVEAPCPESPNDFADVILKVLDSDQFYSHLVKIPTGPHKGKRLFLVTGHSLGGDLNRIAWNLLQMECDSHVVVTMARRCGRNDRIYDFASICPQMAADLFRSQAWTDALDDMRTQNQLLAKAQSSIDQRDKHTKQVSTLSMLERSREWWELFVGNEEGEWGGTTVWCAACHAKYKRVRTCRSCRMVSYCSSKCMDDDRSAHATFCKKERT